MGTFKQSIAETFIDFTDFFPCGSSCYSIVLWTMTNTGNLNLRAMPLVRLLKLSVLIKSLLQNAEKTYFSDWALNPTYYTSKIWKLKKLCDMFWICFSQNEKFLTYTSDKDNIKKLIWCEMPKTIKTFLYF